MNEISSFGGKRSREERNCSREGIPWPDHRYSRSDFPRMESLMKQLAVEERRMVRNFMI